MKKSLNQIKIDIPEWMKRYDENNGGLNFEFTANVSNLDEIMCILNSFHSNCSNWFALTCECCQERYGKNYIHFSLTHDVYSEHISKASNLLTRTNYKRL